MKYPRKRHSLKYYKEYPRRSRRSTCKDSKLLYIHRVDSDNTWDVYDVKNKIWRRIECTWSPNNINGTTDWKIKRISEAEAFIEIL